MFEIDLVSSALLTLVCPMYELYVRNQVRVYHKIEAAMCRESVGEHEEEGLPIVIAGRTNMSCGGEC